VPKGNQDLIKESYMAKVYMQAFKLCLYLIYVLSLPESLLVEFQWESIFMDQQLDDEHLSI